MKFRKKFEIGGLRYRTRFVSKREMKKVAGDPECEGLTDFDNGIIYLAKALRKNKTRLRDTLFHEALGHALLDSSGIGHWLKKRFRLKEGRWHRFQEYFIRFHTPALISALKSLGVLK